MVTVNIRYSVVFSVKITECVRINYNKAMIQANVLFKYVVFENLSTSPRHDTKINQQQN